MPYFCSMPRNSNPKERVLETASRLFYEQGYNSTGINQILAESNVAKASLYQHYGSKEELGIEYIRSARKDWFIAINAFLLNFDTPGAKLLGCFDFLEKNNKNNHFKGCRFIKMLDEISLEDSSIRNEIVAHKTAVKKLIADLLTEVKGKDESTKKTAETIYLLFEAAIIGSKIYRDLWPIQAAKSTVQELIK